MSPHARCASTASQSEVTSAISRYRRDANRSSPRIVRRRLAPPEGSTRCVLLVQQNGQFVPGEAAGAEASSSRISLCRGVSRKRGPMSAPVVDREQRLVSPQCFQLDRQPSERAAFCLRHSNRHVVYGTVFLPWLAPVTLLAGDIVAVDLEATLIRDDYIWTWRTCVLDRGKSGAEKANFKQSTFFGMPLSPGTLQKRAANYTPILSEDGQIARFVLGAMNGGASVGEIARQVSTEFPARFPRPLDALSYVADLSRRSG